MTGVVPLSSEPQSRPWLVLFEATLHGETGGYAMPVRIVWDRLDRRHFNPKALAAVRQGAREGTLIDVATDPHFVATLLSDLRGSTVLKEGDYRIHFKPTDRLRTIEDRPIENVRAVETEQSNSTALVDDRYVVKVYRKLENGLNPEIEIGRFLTDIAGFSNTPALLGSIELKGPDTESAIAIVHAFVENQGDAWTLTGTALDRFVEEQSLVGAADTTPANDEKSAYQRYMMQTGKRIAEMQMALASRDDLADFRAVPATSDDTDQMDRRRRGASVARLRAAREHQGQSRRRATGRATVAAAKHIADRLAALLPQPEHILNIRHHGDFHLGQMLIVKEDIFIIDFEGEPRRTLAERRMKAPAARDVAGLIRSIDYSVSAALERSLKVKADDHGQLQIALGAMARRKRSDLPDRLSCGDDRCAAVAGGRVAGRWPAAVLPAGEGVLRNRIRAGASAGLAARRAERRAARAGGRRADMNKLSSEAHAILRGRHSDPFRYLGRHQENGHSVVRAFLPDASNVEVIDDGGATAPLACIHKGGLFSGEIPDGSRTLSAARALRRRHRRARGPLSLSADPERLRSLPARRRHAPVICMTSSAPIR